MIAANAACCKIYAPVRCRPATTIDHLFLIFRFTEAPPINHGAPGLPQDSRCVLFVNGKSALDLRRIINEAPVKIAAKALGIVLMLVGLVWILQGFNILPGSFMTGQIQWAVFGAIAMVLGAASFSVGRQQPPG